MADTTAGMYRVIMQIHHTSRYPIALWLLSAGLCACTFDTKGIPLEPRDAAEADAPVADAPVDAPEPDAMRLCTPNEAYCENNVLHTCDAQGAGPVGDGVPCDFVCGISQDTAQCLYASNVPEDVYMECRDSENSIALTPMAGDTVTIDEPDADNVDIVWRRDGNIVETINAVKVERNETAWFCLSKVDIPADVTVGYMPGEAEEAIIWVVDGDVTIAGTMDFSGGHANRTTGGVFGPGGHSGADISGVIGKTGGGPCPGQGGQSVGKTGDRGGGGGGGGGFAGLGGQGGSGLAGYEGATYAQGGLGDGPCDNQELVPLAGGSGGGGGGDGDCTSGACGWPGGGGGGALQIASRSSITITGTVEAGGGNGYGAPPDSGSSGGGGGGAGGGLLLEAPMITISGTMTVDGGNGGQSLAGLGGAGASGETIDGTRGVDYTAGGQGGSGGGGGGGRIRLNTPAGTQLCTDSMASPAASCTSGSLHTAP